MLCGTDIPWGYVVPIFTGIRFRDWRKWRGKARRRKIPQQSEDDFSPDGQARTGRLARTAAIADLCRQKSEKHIFIYMKNADRRRSAFPFFGHFLLLQAPFLYLLKMSSVTSAVSSAAIRRNSFWHNEPFSTASRRSSQSEVSAASAIFMPLKVS